MGEIDAERLRQGAEYAATWIELQLAVREGPGTVFGVRWKDETVVLRAWGKANIERDEPMRTDHIFRVASHSKTFTAVAIMQLVERGSIRLDDPLGRYIPWLGEVHGQATVRQALNHTSGTIRDGLDCDHWQLGRPFPDADGLRSLVENGGEVLPPNDRFKYSNVAYSLLGLVIEAASGQPYAEYVREHIVNRLGLQNTGPETDSRVRERLVTGYTPPWPGIGRLPFQDISTGAMAAATGFYSTAEDLLRYASAHFMGNEELLSDRSKREMQRPYWDVGDGSHYGLGLAVVNVGERRLVGHSGGFPGHTTRTLLDPVDRLAVVALTNQSAGPAADIVNAAIRIINYSLSRPAASLEDARKFDSFVGRFWSLGGAVDVVRFGSTLAMLDPLSMDPTAEATTLEPIDVDSLRIHTKNGYGSPEETVKYERDAEGRVTRVRDGGISLYPDQLARQRLEGVTEIRLDEVPVTF